VSAGLAAQEQRPQAVRQEPFGRNTITASSEPPSTICQVLGEASKATERMISKTSAPRNGASTLPVPARMVMKMNSPEVVQ